MSFNDTASPPPTVTTTNFFLPILRGPKMQAGLVEQFRTSIRPWTGVPLGATSLTWLGWIREKITPALTEDCKCNNVPDGAGINGNIGHTRRRNKMRW